MVIPDDEKGTDEENWEVMEEFEGAVSNVGKATLLNTCLPQSTHGFHCVKN